MTAPLLSIRDLVIEAETGDGQWRRIVDGVSLDTARGEVLGLIGESGAGKSTIGLAALGYTRPHGRFGGGSVLLDGQDLLALPPRARLKLRGRRVAYVAQSAAAAFNPAKTIDAQVGEILVRHGSPAVPRRSGSPPASTASWPCPIPTRSATATRTRPRAGSCSGRWWRWRWPAGPT